MVSTITPSRNISNILTFLRVGLVPFFISSLFGKSALSGFMALSLFVVACFTDYLDGHLARKRCSQSRFGEFFDPLADKILIGGAFISFSLLPELNVPFPIVAVILIREVFVTCLRIVALKRRNPMRTEYAGKLKTASQMFGILIILTLHLLVKISLSQAGDIFHRLSLDIWQYLFGLRVGRIIKFVPLSLVSVSAFIAIYSMARYIRNWKALVVRKP